MTIENYGNSIVTFHEKETGVIIETKFDGLVVVSYNDGNVRHLHFLGLEDDYSYLFGNYPLTIDCSCESGDMICEYNAFKNYYKTDDKNNIIVFTCCNMEKVAYEENNF